MVGSVPRNPTSLLLFFFFFGAVVGPLGRTEATTGLQGRGHEQQYYHQWDGEQEVLRRRRVGGSSSHHRFGLHKNERALEVLGGDDLRVSESDGLLLSNQKEVVLQSDGGIRAGVQEDEGSVYHHDSAAVGSAEIEVSGEVELNGDMLRAEDEDEEQEELLADDELSGFLQHNGNSKFQQTKDRRGELTKSAADAEDAAADVESSSPQLTPPPSVDEDAEEATAKREDPSVVNTDEGVVMSDLQFGKPKDGGVAKEDFDMAKATEGEEGEDDSKNAAAGRDGEAGGPRLREAPEKEAKYANVKEATNRAAPGPVEMNTPTSVKSEKPDPSDMKNKGRIVITDVKVDEELSDYNMISLFVTTNSTVPTDTVCHAYRAPNPASEGLNAAPAPKRPKADSRFLRCGSYSTNCHTGEAQDCTRSGCVVSISDLRVNQKYAIWCAPQFQPNLDYYWPNDNDVFPADQKGIQATTIRANPKELHTVVGFENGMAALGMVVYIYWSTTSAAALVHESGVAVVCGLLFGGVLKLAFDKTMEFNYNLFSYFLLPMVIFSAGLHVKIPELRRRAGYIVFLGIFGTFASFGALMLVSYIFLPRVLGLNERLIMASALSATDTLASLSFIKQRSMPVIRAIVFGEGILNDVVSILMATSLGSALVFSGSSDQLSGLSVLGFAVYYLTTSALCGMFFGGLVVLMARHSNSGRDGGQSVTEQEAQTELLEEEEELSSGEATGSLRTILLMLLVNYACYVVAETCDFSAILALFVSSAITGSAVQQEVSPGARRAVDHVSAMMSVSADSLVYAMFGMCLFSVIADEISVFAIVMNSLLLIVFYSCAVVLTRLILVFGIGNVVRTASRMFNRDYTLTMLSWKEQVLVALGGMMRGSIAFALVLKNVPPAAYRTYSDTVLVSTGLGLVIVNTTCFSILIPMICRSIGVARTGGVNADLFKKERAAEGIDEEGDQTGTASSSTSTF